MGETVIDHYASEKVIQLKSTETLDHMRRGLSNIDPTSVYDDSVTLPIQKHLECQTRVRCHNYKLLDSTLTAFSSVERKFLSQLANTILVLEGGIGAGKTTLSMILKKKLKSLGYKVFLVIEPVPANLNEYIANPHRLALLFQLQILFNRTDLIIKSLSKFEEAINDGKTAVLILDRVSLQGDEIFALSNHDMGYMTSNDLRSYHDHANTEFIRLKAHHDALLKNIPAAKFMVFYLKISLEESIARIMKRCQMTGSLEKDYDEKYLERLIFHYENMFPNNISRNYNIVEWAKLPIKMKSSTEYGDEKIWRNFLAAID